MLAVLGFVTAGILFGLFALSFENLTTKKLALSLRQFSMAYYILAATFLLFGIASAIGTQAVLAAAVVAGDVLLLVATTFILQLLFERHPRKRQLVYGALALGFVLILVRTIFFYPRPYMTNEILFFNSQRFVSFTLASVFLLVWLPVNLRMSQLVSVKTPSIVVVNAFLYVGATLSAAIFLLAKTPLAVVLSFTALATAFFMLIISNAYIEAAKGTKHGR